MEIQNSEIYHLSLVNRLGNQLMEALKCFGYAMSRSHVIVNTLTVCLSICLLVCVQGCLSAHNQCFNRILQHSNPLTFCGILHLYLFPFGLFFRFCYLRKLHKYATKCNQCIIVKRVVLYIATHTQSKLRDMAHHVANSFGLSIFQPPFPIG